MLKMLRINHLHQLRPDILSGLTLGIFSLCLSQALPAGAQEDWVEVTQNAVGDRFLVDQNSIRAEEGFVWYWEYRDFPQPNDALVDAELDQPVYGVLFYRSADCTNSLTRLRRMTVHSRNRQVIHRAAYNDNGPLAHPMAGSSAASVLRYVCSRAEEVRENSTLNP